MALFAHNTELLEQIKRRLNQFDQIQQTDTSLTRAAVVLGVSQHHNEACLLLTRRSSKLRKHAGQYALPGGKLDAGETIIEAALRELSEELSLTPSSNSVLGTLDDMVTHSGFCITPVVVWIDNHNNLVANPDEVAAVFEIPLSELEQVDLDLSDEDNDSVMSLHLPSVGTSVYSPTAAIIYQFREVALRGVHTRVANFGQPKFAWR